MSRLAERFRTKRVCPRCGLAIRVHTQTCPDCKHNFLMEI